MTRRKTVGAVAGELAQKPIELQSPVDLERAMHDEYEKNIHECIARGLKDQQGNFYVVVLTKSEKIMPNVIRNFFFYRHDCPTPDYDQTVYYYDRDKNTITFLWVIPSQDACHHLKAHALEVAPEEKDLLRFVLDFADGTLFTIAKQRNGEIERPGCALQETV